MTNKSDACGIGPNRAVVFLYQGKANVVYNDISICTQLDIRRLNSLLLMSEEYSGPKSVAIFVRDKSVEIPIITNFWIRHLSAVKGPLALHLVYYLDAKTIYDDREYLYPTNLLRNVAIEFAATKYIILLEADMLIPKRLREYMIRHLERGHFDNVHNVAYILPLWYYNGDALTVKANNC